MVGTVYRTKYYFAWALGHCSLALAGMDFLRWGPDGKPVWGRCRNAQPLKVEFCESSRLLAGFWNTTTGSAARSEKSSCLPPSTTLLSWCAGALVYRGVGCVSQWVWQCSQSVRRPPAQSRHAHVHAHIHAHTRPVT